MTEYCVKSTVCFLVLYLGYIVFSRNSRNYHVNRVILLLSVLFALTVPVLNMAPITLQKFPDKYIAPLLKIFPASNYLSAHELAIKPVQPDFPEISSVILLVYAIISFALFIRFSIHISLLLLKGYRADKITYNGTTLALITEKVNPFTFFKTIFLSRENYEDKTLDEVLILHELAHKKQLHSVDVVIMELVLVFFWFNPFVYLFKKLIKANHEYLADDFVLRSGVSFNDYSNKIINNTFKNRTLDFASGFNYLFVRNRLIMLSKYDQKKRPAWQLILFIPLFVILFLTTAFKNANDFIPASSQGMFYADEIYWSKEKEIRIQGILKVKFGPNDFTGEGSFSGFDKGTILIVDGKQASLNQSINVSRKRCNLIILTKEQAKSKYGTDGSVGAVEVYTSR